MQNGDISRDRASGWKHAKLSGHSFEKTFEKMVKEGTDTDFIEKLKCTAKRLGINGEPIDCDSSFGKENFTDFTNGHTPSKADAIVKFENGDSLGVSIKKSESGQVHLTKLCRFILGFEYFTSRKIPEDAIWCLKALSGETDGELIEDFANGVKFSQRFDKHTGRLKEIEDNRLFAITINNSFPKKWNGCMDWFKKEIKEITRMVFAKGYCIDPKYHPKLIYYRNHDFISIEDIVNASQDKFIGPDPRGGSTIKLPWGFLQVHRPTRAGAIKKGPFQLQFHHKLERIRTSLID